MDCLKYYLMHKDVPAAILTLNKNDWYMMENEILDCMHAPIGYQDSKVFRNWWTSGAIPKHQMNQAVLLDGKSNMEYMMQNLGLSLVDCYWIKPLDSSLTWGDVNLYENNFAENDFYSSDLENISPFKPSATTQGELQKRWIIIDGERFLVKGNYGAMYRQSLNEVFVSDVHKLQGAPHTSYETIKLPTTMGEGIGCICKNFSTPALEFVPAYDITFYDKQPNTESVYQHYINTCVKLGISTDEMQQTMDYMVLYDFLFTNTDRHLLNLGILRDPDTLKFVKPAPLFDTGNSMFYAFEYNPKSIFEIKTTSFYKTECKMLEQVKNRSALDLDLVPDATELGKWYCEDPYSVVYLDNLKRGYEKKIEMLDAFQRGYSINPRSKEFYATAGYFNEKEEQEFDLD